MSYSILPEFEVDTPEWHEARRSSLGASEVAAVLGLSPWQTPLSVYMAKMGIRNEIPENLAYFGRALEPVIAGWISDTHPEVGLMSDGFSARADEWPWLTVSPDRIAFVPPSGGLGVAYVPVELKTSSAFGRDKWSEGVPLFYQAQVQAQIAVLDAPYGWLAVLHGGNEPELYRIERDDDFIENHLIPKTKAFWEDHVLAQVPPEPTTTEEAIALWPGTEGVTVEGGPELLDLWDTYGLMQAESVDLTERLDAVKLELQRAMQDAVAVTYQGQELFTWKPRKGSTRFDAAALKTEHPDIHAQYVKQGDPTRVFRRIPRKEVL